MVTMTLDEVKKLPPLTEEEIATIRNAKPNPDEDCPAQTKEQLKQFRPWYEVHPNGSDIYKVSVKKQSVNLRIDADILEKFKSKGKGYQTRINAILRKAVMSGDY